MPGVKRVDELIRTFHQELPTSVGKRRIPSPPPSRSHQLLKNVTGTLERYLRHWPEEAIDYLDAEMSTVIDSIEVYVQEQFGEADFPDVIPRIAIREKATEMKLIRAFTQRIAELTDEQRTELLRPLEEPDALRNLCIQAAMQIGSRKHDTSTGPSGTA